jgi:D-tyrosyl-tRNA(Tyr) deacylase
VEIAITTIIQLGSLDLRTTHMDGAWRMKALLQRVTSANVVVGSEIIGEIDSGWVVLLGVGRGDSSQDVVKLVDKILGLRLFSDEQGRFNLSVQETKGAILIVSQFTLFADCTRGRRPGFSLAASPDMANQLYEMFIDEMKKSGLVVQTGRFGADMKVALVNDGPVTVMLDTHEFGP